jgi:hypothetical protein
VVDSVFKVVQAGKDSNHRPQNQRVVKYDCIMKVRGVFRLRNVNVEGFFTIYLIAGVNGWGILKTA